MKNHIHLEGVIEKGKISYPIKANQTKLNNFLANTPEGARVEIFISVNDGKGSNAQLARIHAMCRQMANDIGYTWYARAVQEGMEGQWALFLSIFWKRVFIYFLHSSLKSSRINRPGYPLEDFGHLQTVAKRPV